MVGAMSVTSRDFWVKVVGFLQQNWALVEPSSGRGIVYFFSDTGGVFDRMQFDSVEEAVHGLTRNGFRRYEDEIDMHRVVSPPEVEALHERPHPSGPIYSSGKFWK